MSEAGVGDIFVSSVFSLNSNGDDIDSLLKGGEEGIMILIPEYGRES